MHDLLLLLIPLVPLAGALLHAALCARGMRRGLAAVPVLTSLASLGIAAFVLSGFERASMRGPIEALMDWLVIGASTDAPLELRLGFRADRLGLVFAIAVAAISAVANLAAIPRGALGEAPRADGKDTETIPRGRFFAAMQLLTGSMLALVLAADLATFFFAWQGIALAAFLLVSSRGIDPDTSGAGMKTFVMARIGDVGLVLGIAAIAVLFDTLDFRQILATIVANARVEIFGINIDRPISEALALPIPELGISAGVGIASLIALATVVRMAQFPLHVWLPDASIAPAPATALLSGAAMTVSGAFLITRLSGLFAEATVVAGVLAILGGITAALAGFFACSQTDLRRGIALTAIGHLGIVMLAFGTGAFGASLAHALAFSVSIAVVVLAAGLVLRATDGCSDLREGLGGLRSLMPATSILFLLGALGLAGLPPFGSFFGITGALAGAKTGFNPALPIAPTTAWVLGLAGTATLAAAALRLHALTFLGGRGNAPLAEHRKESILSTGPLGLLAVASVAVSALVVPFVLGFGALPSLFEGIVEPAVEGFGQYPRVEGSTQAGEWLSVGLTIGAIVLGAVVGHRLGRRRPAPLPTPSTAGANAPVLDHGSLVDRVFITIFLRPLDRLTLAFAWFERRALDFVIVGIGRSVRFSGFLVSRFQNGDIQSYGIALLLGVAAFLLFQVLTRI